MGAVYFYHLTRSALDQALPLLLERAMGAGWRVAVRAGDPARLDWLDQRLWLGAEEGFLAHGRAGGPHDDLQPVLLIPGGLPDGFACLMVIDGAEVAAAEVLATERACILFDGNDPAAVDRARGQWKVLTSAGLAAQYWSEEGGRWEKKAESPAA